MALENLPEDQVRDELNALEGWTLRAGMIERTFEFPSFSDAVAFVNRVADVADDYDHHPDIDVRYTKVRIATVTHATKGITQRDFELARRIAAVA